MDPRFQGGGAGAPFRPVGPNPGSGSSHVSTRSRRQLTVHTLRKVVLAFCQGLVDSLKFSDIVNVDAKLAAAAAANSSSALDAGGRTNGSGSSLAKRRALLRREQQQQPQTLGPDSQHQQPPRLLQRLLNCCLLNGCVFLLSILAFNNVILPFVEFAIYRCMGADTAKWLWTTVFPVLSYTFATFWVLPFFLLSKFVNAIWFADIADTAYRNAGPAERPRMMNTVSVAIADTVFTIIIETIFLFQAKAFCLILTPFTLLGNLVNFLHLCLLHSLYCFEYKWFNQGLELHKRLDFIETNWPYFLGFGLPLAAITSYFPSVVVSGCVFAMFFPFFIVSGNCAQIVTVDEEIKLRIFHPTIVISNCILTKTFQDTSSSSRNTPPPGTVASSVRHVRR